MSLPIYSFSEPITEPDILESIRALPTEDDLPSDDGEPMETPRHRDQMILLIESLKLHWADRQGYYVGGNMFVHYDPQNKLQQPSDAGRRGVPGLECDFHSPHG
jgi:hypothetical protein